MKIGTHNGTFHADDVFAVAAVRICTVGPHEIVRTRDTVVLETCDVVVDVGGAFAPAQGRFDHHQKGGAGARPNGVPYSAFGLVWGHYAPAIFGGPVAAKVDETLVQSVDAADCGFALQGKPLVQGVKTMSVSGVISLLNPTWEEEGSATLSDAAFLDAVNSAGAILCGAIRSARGLVNARALVQAAQVTMRDEAVIVLDRFIPWTAEVFPNEKHLFVVFPDIGGTWRLQCIPSTPGSFEKRKALPASWGGQSQGDFDAITGVPGGIFCHNGLFIAGHRTKEGALALAALAVEA